MDQLPLSTKERCQAARALLCFVTIFMIIVITFEAVSLWSRLTPTQVTSSSFILMFIAAPAFVISTITFSICAYLAINRRLIDESDTA